jgi:hypothetical protein
MGQFAFLFFKRQKQVFSAKQRDYELDAEIKPRILRILCGE